MKNYFNFKCLVLLIFINSNCFSQNSDYVNSLKKEISKEMASLMKKYAVTGVSIALIDDQQTVWAQGFGFSDLENKIQSNSRTNYRIGSMGKVFTATAIMKLSQQGKINIDSSYIYYVPSFSIKSNNNEDIKAITPRNLMSHHSGLPGDIYKGFFSKEPEYYTNIIPLLKDEYLAYPANYIFGYSNLGYDLLGQLIENVTQSNYSTYMKNNVFSPLKMDHTIVEDRNDTISYSKPYEWNHFKDEGKIRDLPAGVIVSNVEDLANYMKMLFANGTFENKSFLDSMTLKEMMTPQYTNATVDKKTGCKIGLPWFFSIPSGNIYNAGKVLFYLGSTSVFKSEIIILPDYKIGVVALSNSASGGKVLDKICKKTLKLALQKQNNLNTKRTIKVKTKQHLDIDLTTFSGDYIEGNGKITKVIGKRNKLITEFNGKKALLLPNNMGSLTIRVHLLGIIPITIKQIEINVCDIDSEKVIYTGDWILGTKLRKVDISEIWKMRVGEYKLLNQGDDCMFFTNCRLKIENGYLIFKSDGWGEFLVLRPINDNAAINMGLGRNMHETIYVTKDDQGNEVLNISGYKLQKIKDSNSTK